MWRSYWMRLSVQNRSLPSMSTKRWLNSQNGTIQKIVSLIWRKTLALNGNSYLLSFKHSKEGFPLYLAIIVFIGFPIRKMWSKIWTDCSPKEAKSMPTSTGYLTSSWIWVPKRMKIPTKEEQFDIWFNLFKNNGLTVASNKFCLKDCEFELNFFETSKKINILVNNSQGGIIT